MVKYPEEKLKACRPLSFWAWNGALEEWRLKEQIDEMEKNEAGGYFMHARSGLKTEYMSDEWLRYIKTCAVYGKEKGMDAWIYDEHGWPSGFAGGRLLEKEEFHDKYILCKKGAYDRAADYVYRIEGKRIVRISEEGPYSSEECINLYIETTVSTVDILNPKVTDAFINNTHEVYAEYFDGKISEYVRGFFTDEPQYQRYHTAYSDMLPEYFQKHYGEDIFESLALLFVDAENHRKFRHQYWKAMQSLMLTNYAKKLYDWCEEHGLEFTGHYIEESSLEGQMWCCAGVMPFYEYEHIPGIDWITSWSENELPPRQVGSVAAQLGKKQVLTEAYAGFGWQITPRDLKRIAEFQFVNGVNLLCEHLFPYSEAGQSKRDFPAHYSNVNPWVKECGDVWHRYITRLSCLLAESSEIVNVAVLHPIRSAYCIFQREEAGGGAEMMELDRNLSADIRSLSIRGINYHFLDETIMERHGYVDGKRIGCGNCTYEYLIFLHVTDMDRHTEKLIQKYVRNGGKILILGNKPSYLEGAEYDYTYLQSNCSLDEICAGLPCHAKNENDGIYSSLREIEGKRFIFAMNMSASCGYDHSFVCKEAESFVEYNLETMESRMTGLEVRFEPGESKILFLREEKISEEEETKNGQKGHVKVFEMKEAWVDFKNNYLTLDKVQYSTDGKIFSDFYYCPGLFQKLLREQYEGDIYFRYEFEIRDIPEQVCLLAERDNIKKCLVNGREIGRGKPSELDRDIFSTEITSCVKEGRNTVTMEMYWHESEEVYHALFGKNVTESLKNKLVYDCELESVYLSGSFGVYSDFPMEDMENGHTRGKNFFIGKKPEKVSEPVKEGFPFFRGKMTIKQEIYLKSANTVLRIPGTWSLADIRINGQDTGRLMLTDSIDISRYASAGNNEIEATFTISNRNLLGPHHTADSFRNVFICPESFDLGESWENGMSELYREEYYLQLLGIKAKI